MINLAALACFALALAIGQLLFKRSAMAIAGLELTDSLLVLARLPAFYGALALYGGSTLLWVWILTRMPLSLAYPVVAAVMVLVPIMGWYFFGERLTLGFWLGASLIVAGILIMQLAA